DADPARTGEAVPYQVAAAPEHARPESEYLDVHAHVHVPVDPAAGLHVDLLVGGQRLLEDVAVAVQPDDALLLLGVEAIDEEPGRGEEHIADALDPVEGVLQVAGRGQELVLPDQDTGTRL